MKDLTSIELREINGGGENADEFYEGGKQIGQSVRAALGTIGLILLFL